MAPLHKIIARESYQISDGKSDGIPVYGELEVLECGHKVKARVDHYGATNAYARRCKQCGKETC